jgi:hypothetical protein
MRPRAASMESTRIGSRRRLADCLFRDLPRRSSSAMASTSWSPRPWLSLYGCFFFCVCASLLYVCECVYGYVCSLWVLHVCMYTCMYVHVCMHVCTRTYTEQSTNERSCTTQETSITCSKTHTYTHADVLNTHFEHAMCTHRHR